jgi:hypothetical protein
MPPPGSNFSPPGSMCIPCVAGTLEVIVWKYAVCWDTPPEGLDSVDPRFPGVLVRVTGMGQSFERRTNSQGKATFSDLIPGSYRITADKAGYIDCTDMVRDRLSQSNPPQVRLVHSADIETHQTRYADLVLWAKRYRYNQDGSWTRGRECERRHTRRPSGFPGGGTLALVLWGDEPGTLIARDITWIILPLLVVAAAAIGFASLLGGHWALYLAGLLLALWAYLHRCDLRAGAWNSGKALRQMQLSTGIAQVA